MKKTTTKKETKPKVPKVRFMSFTMSATIPTVQYGNIQPSITVEANTIEDAREFVEPIIEEMYDKYCEQIPRFLKKPIKEVVKEVPAETIVETVKVEVPVHKPDPASIKTTVPEMKPNIAHPDPTVPPAHPVNAKDVPFEDGKDEAYLKTEGVIKSAMTIEAIDMIIEKIEASVKIKPEDKPALILLAHQRKSFISF